jgi:hypothetical protein
LIVRPQEGDRVAKVDDLMAMFAARPSTVICRGPEHPTHPDPSLTDRLRLWLETHPFLHRDEGYVQFLERYCGAAIGDKASDFCVTVHGFHPEVGYLDEYDFCTYDPTVPGLDARGLYPFALLAYDLPGPGKRRDRRVLMDFCFDGSGTRPWGVYRSAIVGREPQTDPVLVCQSFCEWLGLVAAGEAHRAEPVAAPDRGGT